MSVLVKKSNSMKHDNVFWGMEIIILNRAMRKALSFSSQSHSEKHKITLRLIFPQDFQVFRTINNRKINK